MKKSVRIFAIIALGLLVGAIGIAPALAKQIDRGRLGLLDSSYAPQAVTVNENEIEWSASNGDDISFVKPDSVGVFYIKDDALESTASGTAKWNGMTTTTASATSDQFRIPDGFININSAGFAQPTFNSGGGFTLTATSYDATTPANTPLSGTPTVTIAGIGDAFVLNTLKEAGTFGLLNNTSANATITAAFSHHIRDKFDASSTALRRAKVISSSDPAGEFAWIFEASGVGTLTTATDESSTVSTDRATVTVLNVSIVDNNDDGAVGASDVTVKVATNALGTAATAVASYAVNTVNFNTGAITFKSTTTTDTGISLPAGAVTVSYKHATPSATARVFRGQILLTSNAAAQGTNNDGVWVQDGDTLTVNYLKSDGTVLDTDTVKLDGVKPTVSAISPADGTITNVVNPTVTFEVTDTGSGITTNQPGVNAITIKINGVDVSTSAPSFQAISNGFRVIFASGTSWITSFNVVDGTAFTWEIKAKDQAGNTQTVTGSSLDVKIDITKPTLSSAVTGTAWVVDTASESTGKNTAVKVVFAEDLDASTVKSDGSDFTVGGVAPTAAIVGSTTGNKGNVYLTVAAQAADAKPEVKVTGGIKDLASNAIVANSVVTATDGLKPTATITVSIALAILADKVKVTVDSDEKLATDGLTVSVQGPTGATGTGLLTTTAATPLKNEGTVTVAAGTGTGKYGVSVRAKDLGNNSTDNLTSVTGETPTKSTDNKTITLKNGPIADANFDGAITAADLTALTNDAADITGNITAVNASARTITLNTAAAGAVLASYKYTKTHVFEVDQTAPTVTFDPADATSIENRSPFIRVIFSDDEYPGDSYKTVTLTKAELTKPDGTTSDVKANFVTSDNKEYIWAASNLALGAYKLVVSGKDQALNEKKDQSATITIKERAKYSVALRPGWNLVSLPGAPASSAINDVVDNSKVDIVLGYDPTVPGGWLTATRDSTGKLDGTLTKIDGTKGYWVHTTTFDPIKVDVPALAAGSAVLPPSFGVSKGWNLVGVSVLELATVDVLADDYFSSIKWARSYTFNTATNAFEGSIPKDGKKVTVGKGYWVYATEAGTLVP